MKDLYIKLFWYAYFNNSTATTRFPSSPFKIFSCSLLPNAIKTWPGWSMKLPPGLVNNFSFSLIANIFAPLFFPIPSSESDLFSAVSKRLISLLNSNSSISHSHFLQADQESQWR